MLYLYNTLTRQKEDLTPLKPGMVSMYHCGPTVYDYAHIGNFRSYIFADILRRTCELSGLSVNQVMNITDVDDKTIRRSTEEGLSLSELTRKYEKIFLEDTASFNIKTPQKILRATDNIKIMVALIEKLIENGSAYKSEDGVYFSISKAKNYGVLSGVSSGEGTRERIKNDEYDKENPQDFALWKFHTEEDGDVAWDAPFGRGRPGWHIECSAMSMDALGETFDIHTGGIDLVFPHHENEIAQSESATGRHFVNIWMHNNHILVEGKKMSKSLGNIITPEDLRKRKISPLAYRYWLMSSHYRTLTNFTFDAVEGAQNAFEKLKLFISDIPNGGTVDIAYKAEFESFVYDDLDTPKAVALMWDLVRDQEVTPENKKATILYFDRVFGLDLDNIHMEEIPADIIALAKRREEARVNRNWHLADEIRNNMEARGYELKDTEEGPKITKK